MNIVKNTIRTLARLAHTVLNLHRLELLRMPFRYFYYYWISAEFKTCGERCFFNGFSTLKGAGMISLGNNIYVGRDVVWEVYDEYKGQRFHPQLTFGDNCQFGDGGHITCINEIKVGNGVVMGRKVLITDNAHGTSERSMMDLPVGQRPIVSKGRVVIEDNVWIGEMVCVMPGVTIGKGSIVAAGSVVTKDVPPYCVAAGVPARVVRQHQ